MPDKHPFSTASPESTTSVRKRRYSRSPAETTWVLLTPIRVEILCFLGTLRFLSLPQIARLCCPSARQDLAEKSARRQMRVLFDVGLVEVLAVPRAALAPASVANDASLLHGSAPNIYTLTMRGIEVLRQAGLLEGNTPRHSPIYGPKNSLFLAHELALRDVRVWLELAARNGNHALEHWRDGQEAAIDLKQTQAPSQKNASFLKQASLAVRPDAWFVLRLAQAVLVGIVEVDRGTERGNRRWSEKLVNYAALFGNRQTLLSVTGYVNARVLVLTPNVHRRDSLAKLLVACAQNAGLPVQVLNQFWITEHTTLNELTLEKALWRRPGMSALLPLIPAKTIMLSPTNGS